jgi:hypothetical protein
MTYIPIAHDGQKWAENKPRRRRNVSHHVAAGENAWQRDARRSRTWPQTLVIVNVATHKHRAVPSGVCVRIFMPISCLFPRCPVAIVAPSLMIRLCSLVRLAERSAMWPRSRRGPARNQAPSLPAARLDESLDRNRKPASIGQRQKVHRSSSRLCRREHRRGRDFAPWRSLTAPIAEWLAMLPAGSRFHPFDRDFRRRGRRRRGKRRARPSFLHPARHRSRTNSAMPACRAIVSSQRPVDQQWAMGATGRSGSEPGLVL